jgi:hypothetical protein
VADVHPPAGVVAEVDDRLSVGQPDIIQLNLANQLLKTESPGTKPGTVDSTYMELPMDKDRKTKRRPWMSDMGMMIIVFVAWLLLTRWILPMMGVST